MTAPTHPEPVDVLEILRIHGGLEDVAAAVAELIEAAAEMNRLAKGPAGGVSSTDKKAIVARVDAALAKVQP